MRGLRARPALTHGIRRQSVRAVMTRGREVATERCVSEQQQMSLTGDAERSIEAPPFATPVFALKERQQDISYEPSNRVVEKTDHGVGRKAISL